MKHTEDRDSGRLHNIENKIWKPEYYCAPNVSMYDRARLVIVADLFEALLHCPQELFAKARFL